MLNGSATHALRPYHRGPHSSRFEESTESDLLFRTNVEFRTDEGMSKTAMIGIIIGAVAAGLVVLAIAVAVLRKVCCSSPSKAGEGAVVTATPAEPSNPSSVGRPPNSSAGGSKTELPMAYAEAIVIAKPVRRSAPARDNNV